jgi:hypothetical protein
MLGIGVHCITHTLPGPCATHPAKVDMQRGQDGYRCHWTCDEITLDAAVFCIETKNMPLCSGSFRSER